jgi:hypothetical protein
VSCRHSSFPLHDCAFSCDPSSPCMSAKTLQSHKPLLITLCFLCSLFLIHNIKVWSVHLNWIELVKTLNNFCASELLFYFWFLSWQYICLLSLSSQALIGFRCCFNLWDELVWRMKIIYGHSSSLRYLKFWTLKFSSNYLVQ